MLTFIPFGPSVTIVPRFPGKIKRQALLRKQRSNDKRSEYNLLAHYITWGPAFDWSPRQQLPVLLNNFSFVVDEHKSIIRIFLRVFLVLFTSQRENTPNSSFFARLSKHIG
mmetsp:Transcript_17924/g.37394  ORF Transcript_17924/g.37394 Transcript_17924/m.37394 type:complete len:111 (+) Transcript_17924:259-591(+)